MEITRLILYTVSIIASLLLAGRLLSGKHTLGRLFGIVWVVWAVNSIVLGFLLVTMIFYGKPPEWSCRIRLLNTILLAATPMTVCLWFARSNHGSE